MYMMICVLQGDGQKERGIYIKSVVKSGAADIVSINSQSLFFIDALHSFPQSFLVLWTFQDLAFVTGGICTHITKLDVKYGQYDVRNS